MQRKWRESHIQSSNLGSSNIALQYDIRHTGAHAPTWDDVIRVSVSSSGCCESRTFLGRMYDYCRQAAHPYRWLIRGWEQNPPACLNLWCRLRATGSL